MHHHFTCCNHVHFLTLPVQNALSTEDVPPVRHVTCVSQLVDNLRAFPPQTSCSQLCRPCTTQENHHGDSGQGSNHKYVSLWTFRIDRKLVDNACTVSEHAVASAHSAYMFNNNRTAFIRTFSKEPTRMKADADLRPLWPTIVTPCGSIWAGSCSRV